MNNTVLSESYTLNNGVSIPKIGLGTWEIADENAANAVRDAVEVGYRHFDTAQDYGNERGVGEGIRTCGLNREDVFVTTKLSAFHKDYNTAARTIDESLAKLELDYIDMMIIHAPQPWTHFREENYAEEGNREAWRALEDAYKIGKLRAIGVSNFKQNDLEHITKHCTILPMVNQILCHISNTPNDLLDYCKSQQILVEAYSPMGHGEMFKNKVVLEMAERYHVGLAALCIRYCLQLGTLPLPKTSNPKHMQLNADVDFEISDNDMDILLNVERIKNYGDFSLFPVYGGKMDDEGNCTPHDFFEE